MTSTGVMFAPEKVERFHKRHLLMPDKELVVLASDYDALLALYREQSAALRGILAITDRNHVVWQAARDAIAKVESQ